MQFLYRLFQQMFRRGAERPRQEAGFSGFSSRDWADLPVHHPTCPEC